MSNVFYRAVQYLKYKKMRSIMLIALFAIMSMILLMAGSLDSTIKSYYNSLDTTNGIAVSVNPKMNRGEPGQQGSNDDKSSQKQERPSMTISNVTTEQLSKIKKLDYITDTKQNTSLNVENSKIEPISYEDSTDSDADSNQNQGMNAMMPANEKNNMNGLRLYGSSNYDLEDIFSESTLSLKSGKMPTKDNEVVISSELASDNSLKLNGTITLKNSSDTSKSKKYTIVGLYTNNATLDEMSMRIVPDNTMYTTYSSVSSLLASNANTMISTMYYIKSVDNFDQFKKDYYSITNTSADNNELTLNDEVYNNTIKPLTQVASSINSAKYIVLALILVVIGIVLYLGIKERNNEIGILYSLSEKKTKIMSQFLIENSILAGLAFVIALIFSMSVGKNIFSILMNMDIFSGVRSGARMMGGGRMNAGMPMSNNGSSTNAIDLNAVFDANTIIFSLGAILILIAIITVVTVSRTLLKRPKEIINS